MHDLEHKAREIHILLQSVHQESGLSVGEFHSLCNQLLLLLNVFFDAPCVDVERSNRGRSMTYNSSIE